MTKEEFKNRWESDETGGGITFHDIAECAKQWGLCKNPYRHRPDIIVLIVCNAAGVKED